MDEYGDTSAGDAAEADDYGSPDPGAPALNHQDLQLFMSRAVEVLLGDVRDRSDPTLLSHFEPVQEWSKYDVQPVHTVLDPHEGKAQSRKDSYKTEEMIPTMLMEPDAAMLKAGHRLIGSAQVPK